MTKLIVVITNKNRKKKEIKEKSIEVEMKKESKEESIEVETKKES